MKLKENPTPYMGEVRVKVKLTNGSDQMLAETGSLARAKVRSCEVEAMVDTGAVRSVIPESVARLDRKSTRLTPVT